MAAKYPNIEVKLLGGDGNAWLILGRMQAALKAGGVSREEIEVFGKEATSGDYNNLLATCMKWVNVT